jgi:hypothetical protein
MQHDNPERNYKMSTSKVKQNTYKVRIKSIYIIRIIIIIIIITERELCPTIDKICIKYLIWENVNKK